MPKAKSKKKEAAPDFSPKLPDNVAAQGDKADALLAGETKEPDKSTAEPAKPVEPTNPEPKKLEPTNPEPVSVIPVQPGTVAPVDDKDWEHKYKVLEGKYNKEIGDLRSGVENLNTVVQQQNSLIEQLQQQPLPSAQAPQGQAAPQTPAASAIKKLNSEEFASYGDEIVWLVDGFNKLIDQNQALMEKVESGPTAGGSNGRLERVEAMAKETATDRYLGHLDKSIPNWRAVNNSAEFKAWLASIDDVTGYRYNDVMRYAANALKHDQVIALFKRYAVTGNVDLGQPIVDAPAVPTGIQRDNGVIDQTVDPLASQLMPDGSVGGGDGAEIKGGNEAAPTREDVAKASALYAKGKITIEDFNNISDRFQKAQAALAKQNG